MAAAVLVSLLGVSAVASAGTQRTSVYLNFWAADGSHLEAVNFVIPLTDKACPDGFSAIPDTKQCGRDVFLAVSLYIGGENLSRERVRLQYRKNGKNDWTTFIMVFSGLRNIEVEPFRDALGLRYQVIGTVYVNTNGGGAWYIAKRRSQHPFLVEVVHGESSIKHIECQLSTTHASL